MGKSALRVKPRPKVQREAAQRLLETQRHHALVTQYLPFATSIANRVARSLSSSVDYDDVLCNARLGLLEAAQRYDAAQQVDFRTFAYYRVRGAIFDGLRKSGWLPRSLYARLKFEEAANDYLQQRSLSHTPPIASQDGEVADTVNSLASIYVMSLDADDDLDVEDTSQQPVDQRTEFHQIRAHMRGAIGELPPIEKQLVMMYYFQNRTLEEVGERLKLSKSWVSRLHARALEILLKRIRQLTKGATDRWGKDDHHGT